MGKAGSIGGSFGVFDFGERKCVERNGVEGL
jgi:hypothetical protein